MIIILGALEAGVVSLTKFLAANDFSFFSLHDFQLLDARSP
jgi:hypothetical protein